MKTNVKKTGECGRLLKIELPADVVQEKFREVYAELKSRASIPGFRSGKAPQDLLERHYGKTAEDEVTQRLILESLKSAVEEVNLTPITSPQIKDIRLKGKSSFSFEAEIEIRPQVKLKSYKNLKVKQEKTEVSAQDIEKALLHLQQMNAQLRKQKSLPALDDNFAQDVAKCASLAELKQLIRNDLTRHSETKVKLDMKNQILEQLLKNNVFSCPASLIEQELKHLVNQAKLRPVSQGVEKEKLKVTAENRVRLSFILDQVACEQEIHVSSEEVENGLKSIEKETGRKINPQQNDLADNLRFQLREEKTIDFLLKEAKINEVCQ